MEPHFLVVRRKHQAGVDSLVARAKLDLELLGSFRYEKVIPSATDSADVEAGRGLHHDAHPFARQRPYAALVVLDDHFEDVASRALQGAVEPVSPIGAELPLLDRLA